MTDTDAQPRSSADTHPKVLTAIMVPLIVGYVAMFTYAMRYTSYDIWGAIFLAPVLIAISVPILTRYARTEANRYIGPILIFALLLKLAAAIPRYLMVAVLYENGDALRYSDTGIALREELLNFDFSFVALGTNSRTGTQFVEIVTGVAYTLVGPSIISGFIFFAWLSYWGLFFFYRAFRVAIPDGDATRYALLLFFLPSMLFWPSSIGKEAWMTLVLGLMTYGSALLLERRRGASVYLALGLAGVLAVRPHMALLAIAGIGLGYVLRSGRASRVAQFSRTRTILGLGVIAVLTLVVTQRVADFFGVDEFNLDTAVETLEYAEGQTSQGGSEYSGTGASLRELPINIITVLFRPFAFEVHNIQALLAALEGTFLMVLFAISLPRLRSIPSRLRKNPYVTYCLIYILLFCFMFSAFQNFGILARQRVLVFPLVLTLLALPMVGARRRRDRPTLETRSALSAD